MKGLLRVDRMTTYVFLAAVVSLVGAFIAYQMWVGARTVPSPVREGFAGPSHGAGMPDCVRQSAESAQLYTLLASKTSTTEEGPDDLREFTVLLGKLACFKQDILSPSGIVSATRSQPFQTSLDLEPIAETTARCFAKTVPKRDLELAFDKWRTRGGQLLKRGCTSLNLSEAERAKVEALFEAILTDLADIAASACFKGEAEIAGEKAPRMVDAYEPAQLSLLREANTYY